MKCALFLFSCFITLCVSESIDNEWITNTISPNQSIEFFIVLKQNTTGVTYLSNYILNHISNTESSNYGKYLTIEQINDIIGTNNQHILNWLNENNIKYQDYSDSIKCTANIETINRLFNTNIQQYRNIYTKRIVFTSPIDYKIPCEIQDNVLFIDGLSNRLYSSPNLKRTNNGVNDFGITREVLMRMYNLYPTQTGRQHNLTVSVGAMEYMGQSGFSNKNLVIDQLANGVESNPITANHIIGRNANPDGESQLDVQVMYWAASDAELWYEDSNYWIYGWAADFVNRKDIPQVVSISWGWNELYQCSITRCLNETSREYVERTNVELMKIAARGTTILVSSGDAGSPGRTNENCKSYKNEYGWNHINPVFPSGSPWVLSVGATYSIEADGRFDYQTNVCNDRKSGITCSNAFNEAGATYSKIGWTSGSGFTHWNKMPDWQHSAVNGYLTSGIQLPDSKYFNANGRAYPDVSAFGHLCALYNGNYWSYGDGTSCSSPIFAGIIANLNSYQITRGRPLLGFVNPLFYKMYSEVPTTFNDILLGNSSCTEFMCCGADYGFKATKGWDPVGGLGTPNVGEIKKYLETHT